MCSCLAAGCASATTNIKTNQLALFKIAKNWFVNVCACACVRTTDYPLAPFTCTCVIDKQNYILSFLNKLAVTIFLPPYRCAFGFYVSPCEVAVLLSGSSKKTQLYFLGHKGRSAQQASEVCEGTNWTSKLAISRLPGRCYVVWQKSNETDFL